MELIQSATSWDNAEMRSFVFADEDDSGNVALCEMEESRLKRGLVGAPPTEGERRELRETSLKTWTEWGVILP